jgi:hypothetical protein
MNPERQAHFYKFILQIKDIKFRYIRDSDDRNLSCLDMAEMINQIIPSLAEDKTKLLNRLIAIRESFISLAASGDKLALRPAYLNRIERLRNVLRHLAGASRNNRLTAFRAQHYE